MKHWTPGYQDRAAMLIAGLAFGIFIGFVLGVLMTLNTSKAHAQAQGTAITCRPGDPEGSSFDRAFVEYVDFRYEYLPSRGFALEDMSALESVGQGVCFNAYSRSTSRTYRFCERNWARAMSQDIIRWEILSKPGRNLGQGSDGFTYVAVPAANYIKSVCNGTNNSNAVIGNLPFPSR
jgi:hypothetical protein